MAYTNKEDQAKCARKHYLNNKEIYKKRAIAHGTKVAKRNREYVRNFLNTHPCVDCGENDIIVLDFDHVKGTKHDNICTMVNARCGLKKICEEIDKCEVRCANCHRRATHKRRVDKKKEL